MNFAIIWNKYLLLSKSDYVMEEQVLNFLNSWKKGILDISKAYVANGDYQEEAIKFIKKHYLFETEDVLFKPTMTKNVLFRNDLNSALSYFIGGSISEDNGFAIKPWKVIETHEVNNLIENNLIAVMGVFNFTEYESNECIKVVFTFILKSTNKALKIKIHHSSIIPI